MEILDAGAMALILGVAMKKQGSVRDGCVNQSRTPVIQSVYRNSTL